jgi:hypothetical protein
MHAITDAQIAYFQTFGFLVLRQAFDADEMAAFSARFDDMLAEDRGGITQPGDVIFADMNTWHASIGGAVGRRHIAVNFSEEPKTDADVEMMVQNYEGVLRHTAELQHSRPGRVFTDAFLRSDDSRIRRLVARWVEMDLK